MNVQGEINEQFMANRTRQRIRRRHGQQSARALPVDDGSMSDVVARLFREPISADVSDAQSSANDDLPIEQIKATIAAIVTTSREGRAGISQAAAIPATAPVQTSSDSAGTTETPIFSERAAPLADQARSSPVTTFPATKANGKTAYSEPSRKTGRKWLLALAAATGVSVSALAVMLGLQPNGPENSEATGELLAEQRQAPPSAGASEAPIEVRTADAGAVTPRPQSPTPVTEQAAASPSLSPTETQLAVAQPPVRIDASLPVAPGTIAAPPSLKSARPASGSADELFHLATATGVAPDPVSHPLARYAPTPSSKPQRLAEAPRLVVPRHVHQGPILPGSAAAIVLEVVESGGAILNQSEREDLAGRVERILETEIDGRSIDLETPSGDVARLRLFASEDIEQNMVVPRTNSVSLIDTDLTVEGGWFAARRAISVRPLPDVQTGMDGGDAQRGTLFQRFATVTSPYGDRWYLVGEQGVAAGYVSAADVSPAETFNGPLGTSWGGSVSTPHSDKLLAETECRSFAVSLEGSQAQSGEVCRHLDGRWLGKAEALPAQAEPALGERHIAEEILSRLEQAAGAEASAALAGDVDQWMRQGVEAVELEVPVASNAVSLELGLRRDEKRTVSLRRAAEMAPPRTGMTVGQGWVEVQRGTQLRPLPSLQTRLSDGELGEGTRLEIMGLVAEAQGSDWAIVGRNGIAKGYVQLADLSWIEARPELRYSANARLHGRVIQDTLTATTSCQSIEIAGTAGRPSSMETCARPDGVWAVSAGEQTRASKPVRVAFVL